MAPWRLAPCLDILNKEIWEIAPDRDDDSDGTIGDQNHQETNSDHNPDANGFVCATDRDKDLHTSFTMEDVVQYLLGECRKPNNVGKDYGRINYIIYNRRIWRADNNWVQETYTGSNPHDKHAHISCEHDLNYINDTRSWGLVERFGFMEKETFFAWLDDYFKRFKTDANGWQSNPIGQAVLDHQFVPNPLQGTNEKTPLYDAVRDQSEAIKTLDSEMTSVQDKLDAITEMLETSSD